MRCLRVSICVLGVIGWETAGGSYPGWLSAMMRIRYPEVVDISYAASAPLGFYSQVCARCVCAAAARRRARRFFPGGATIQLLQNRDRECRSR